jgi:hypothetical protein
VSPVATGTCSATNSTSQTTPDLTQIVTQLVASGVPQSMINTITSELNVIFKSLNTGSVMVP